MVGDGERQSSGQSSDRWIGLVSIHSQSSGISVDDERGVKIGKWTYIVVDSEKSPYAVYDSAEHMLFRSIRSWMEGAGGEELDGR